MEFLEELLLQKCHLQVQFSLNCNSSQTELAMLQKPSSRPQLQCWITFLDPWVPDFYWAVGWGLAPHRGEDNSSQHPTIGIPRVLVLTVGAFQNPAQSFGVTAFLNLPGTAQRWMFWVRCSCKHPGVIGRRPGSDWFNKLQPGPRSHAKDKTTKRVRKSSHLNDLQRCYVKDCQGCANTRNPAGIFPLKFSVTLPILPGLCRLKARFWRALHALILGLCMYDSPVRLMAQIRVWSADLEPEASDVSRRLV